MLIEMTARRIKSHEGFARFPYRCPRGKLTIGYGRNLEDVGIDQGEADFLLARDLDRAAAYARRLAWYPSLDDVRKSVILELIFWLGWGGFMKFVRFSRYMAQGNYKSAAKELLDSRAAEQAPARMRALAALLVSCFLILFCPAPLSAFSLSWKDNSTNESGFEIERADANSSPPVFVVVGRANENATSFVDAGADVSRPTCYRVRAFRDFPSGRVFSAYSNTACSVRIVAPLGLVVSIMLEE